MCDDPFEGHVQQCVEGRIDDQWSTPNDGRRKPATRTWFEREDFNNIIGRAEEG
jgi:hypothetical protein